MIKGQVKYIQAISQEATYTTYSGKTFFCSPQTHLLLHPTALMSGQIKAFTEKYHDHMLVEWKSTYQTFLIRINKSIILRPQV